MNGITFVAFDTETTGFSPTKNRVLEVGAVKFRDGKIIGEKTWLINPHQKIAYWARKAHGISNKELKDAPSFKGIYAEYEAFTKDCVLFAHNARFDVNFMGEEALRAGLPITTEPTLDTLHLFRNWWPDADSHTLGSLTEYLKIKTGVFHRATADARYTILIFNKGMKTRGNTYTYADLVADSGGEMFFSKE